MKTYHSIIQWLFTRLYHELAWLYDLIASLVSWGHWDNWVIAFADQIQGDALELGCGTGHLQARLHGRSALLIGLDLSPQMLQLTRQRSLKQGLSPKLLRANAQYIPLASQSFDTIVATFPSEYILQSNTLAEIRRLLRPSGSLLVLMSASLPGPAWYRGLVELAYRLTLQAGTPAQQSDSRPIAFLPESIQQRFLDAGLVAQPLMLETKSGTLFGIIARHDET